MEVKRVGRYRPSWPGARMDMCSMASRKLTQLSFHCRRPLFPAARGTSARLGPDPGAPVAPSRLPLPLFHPARAPGSRRVPLALTFEVALEDELEEGPVVIAPQPQILVHVALAQAELSRGVRGVHGGPGVKELGVRALPLVHLPWGGAGCSRMA